MRFDFHIINGPLKSLLSRGRLDYIVIAYIHVTLYFALLLGDSYVTSSLRSLRLYRVWYYIKWKLFGKKREREKLQRDMYLGEYVKSITRFCILKSLYENIYAKSKVMIKSFIE